MEKGDEKLVEGTESDNNCDKNTSPIANKSCQFLKCIRKDRPCDSDEINGDNGADNEPENAISAGEINEITLADCLDNACACDNFVSVDADQIFAKANEDGDWTISWSIDDRHEQDFIALCYVGETLFIIIINFHPKCVWNKQARL